MKVRGNNKIIQSSGVFASFLTLGFMTAMVAAPIFKSSADSVNVGVGVNSVISLSMSDSSVMIDAPVGGGFGSDYTNTIVLTNSAFGYTLAIEDADSDTSLTSTTSTDTVTSSYSGAKTYEKLDNNTWGFSVDGTKFFAMPEKNKPLILLKSDIPTSDDGATTTLTFGVKTSRGLASGTYTDRIIVSVYTNGVDGGPEGVDPSSDDPEELSPDGKPSDDYNANNQCITTKTIFDIETMQRMTPCICANTTTPTGSATAIAWSHTTDTSMVPRTVLTDVRDGNRYLISKLADGNCYMSQNLALDLDPAVPLTSQTSDINSVASWTPKRKTLTAPGTIYSSAEAAYADDYSYHPISGEDYYQGGTVKSGSPTADTDEYLWEKTGNYYNYAAANAGRTNNASPRDSICPRGWAIPGSQWAQLVNYTHPMPYGQSMNYPHNYVNAGRYSYYEGKLVDQGSVSTLWSSQYYGSGSAYYMAPTNAPNRRMNDWTDAGRGYSVRCVAR